MIILLFMNITLVDIYRILMTQAVSVKDLDGTFKISLSN